MRVLKAGKLPKDNGEYRGKCTLCGCEVAAHKSDPELKSGYSGMDAQHGYYVLCPTDGCGRQIDMVKVTYR
jgi:hypothetical protein